MTPNSQASQEPIPFREWAVVELMGHLKVVGLVTEAQIAGTKLLRVEAANIGADPISRFDLVRLARQSRTQQPPLIDDGSDDDDGEF